MIWLGGSGHLNGLTVASMKAPYYVKKNTRVLWLNDYYGWNTKILFFYFLLANDNPASTCPDQQSSKNGGHSSS